MSVTASSNNGWNIGPQSTQLHPGRKVNMQASQSAGYGQAVFYNASGHVALNDGATPNLICAGVIIDRLVTGDSVAGGVSAHVHRGEGNGQPSSTIANDAFLAADVLAVAFDAGNGVPGKLSNSGGSVRSIMGLVLGLDANGNPNVWAGPEASLMARSLLVLDSFTLASTEIADAAANTAISEKAIRRPKVKGVVTAVRYTGSALVIGDTDYVTVSVAKRDGAGGGATVIATYDSRAAGNGAATAFVPKSFTLSVVAGALNLLETDVVTITTVKGGSGQVLTGVVDVIGKAI